MKIFVGGSLENIEMEGELCKQFVERLSELIVERGHILYNGCRGSLDKKVAESADAWLTYKGKDPRTQIISYFIQGEEKIHNKGSIYASKLKDWSIEKVTPEIPEQIALADITIFIAGGQGTLGAAFWAKQANKPILGIGMFGGSGAALHESKEQEFRDNYGYLLNKKYKYEDLNQFTEDGNYLANIVISVCEDLKRSNQVFPIMSFEKEYDDVYEIFKSACEKNDYVCGRTDLDSNFTNITPRILDGIKQSDFVIADISEMSPNVFYEIGYAKGINRDVIITAREEKRKKLPFDVKDFPVIFYNKLNLAETLEPKLDKFIKDVNIKK